MLGIGSFGFCAFAFAALGALILVKGTSSKTGRLFVIALFVQVLWAIAFASAYTIYSLPTWFISATEGLRTFAWTLFLLSFSQERNPAQSIQNATAAPSGSSSRGFNVSNTNQFATIAAAALCSCAIGLDIAAAQKLPIGTLNLGAKVIAAVLGLWCIEQFYRNTPTSLRWAIKFLCIALASLFSYDMVMYTEALLFERINYAWMTARGGANALLVPLLAISAARNRGWKIDIMVSRRMVLHSATLMSAGVFLIVMSTIGYYVRYFGGQWGEIAQALVVFTGVIALLTLLLSGQIRAKLRVFVAKNFFSYRYDYREEWLALTHSFSESRTDKSSSGEGDLQSLHTKAILALGRFVESHEGAIWMLDKADHYQLVQQIPMPTGGTAKTSGADMAIAASNPFVEFMRLKEWIVLLPEMAYRKDLYGDIEVPTPIARDANNWLVVPLMRSNDLIGFVTVRKPTASMEINWEVRDILKTAARQTASYLAVEDAVEELIVARQFESFNRMSAFVVHDLKNLVAQLRLLLTNAERHKHNPEFQQDMLATVENVMERMQGLLLQLRAGTTPIEQARIIAISDVIDDAVDSKKSLPIQPIVTYENDAARAHIKAHHDRLARVVGHLIQNASEACKKDGKIAVNVSIVEKMVVLKVRDTGLGMSEHFLRNQLFKPFESTKAHGMGIGTFESKEYIGQVGGKLEVESELNQGSVFSISLPLAMNIKEAGNEPNPFVTPAQSVTTVTTNS
jgi:putative PEP-CTERM system histidine kinase